MALELDHNPESLCSQKVRLAFAEKALAYERHVIELADDTVRGRNLSPEYRRVNPPWIARSRGRRCEPVDGEAERPEGDRRLTR